MEELKRYKLLLKFNPSHTTASTSSVTDHNHYITKAMSPSDSQERLCPDMNYSVSAIYAPLNHGQDSSLNLNSLSLSQTWSEKDFFEQSSVDLPEETIKAMAFKDKAALRGDLKFILTVPEMCDVRFLVGSRRFPMYGVKAILGTRSRVFFEQIISKQNKENPPKHKGKNWIVTQLKRLLKKEPAASRNSQLVIDVPEFEPVIFGHILSYIQTGDIDVEFANLIGVMNAADVYAMDGLRSACYEFARNLISVETVLPLLISLQPYTSYKWTKILLIEILKLVCDKAQDVLRLPEFIQLPIESVIMILTKTGLRATEVAKWETVLRWTFHNCNNMANAELQQTLRDLTSGIDFHDIPVKMLKKEIKPLAFLSDDVINRAITHQTSPRLIIGQDQATSTNRRHHHSKTRSRKEESRNPENILAPDCYHLQPLASSTFNSSREFSDGFSSGNSF